jgi:hypothetical protein
VRHLALFASLAAMIVVGCKSPDDDLEPAFVPKVHAFEGSVDPKLAGKWVSTDGVSTLDLAKDGGLKVQTLRPSPGGKSASNVEGNWLVSEGSLLMKYGSAGQGETVLKYEAKVAGSTMTLQQEGGRLKTVYQRK